MITVMDAALRDLDALVAVDAEVTGSDARRNMLQRSIQKGTCLIARVGGETAGFLTYHRHFFGQWFIELMIVDPSKRRRGAARALMQHLEQRLGPAGKLFSSTNQSNTAMQQVFAQLGYIKSGMIDNLDEGDPEIVYFKRLGRDA